ncbi:MAG: hypothetical protein R3E45_05645 [Rhodocyclaceae bacterium]
MSQFLTAPFAALALALSPPLLAASTRPDPPNHRPALVRVSQVFEWIATAPDTGILWLGVEEPYRVDVSPGCGNFLTEPPQRISVHGHELRIGSDELFNQTGHCRITRLQAADRRQLQSAGLQRENAQRLVAQRVPGPTRQK